MIYFKGVCVMIVINNVKFAKNDKEVVDTLFEGRVTASGTYKVYKKRVALYDLQGKHIANVTKKGGLIKVSYMEDGRKWYNYGDIDLIGNDDGSFWRDIDKVKELLKECD